MWCAGCVWNSLPQTVLISDSLSVFKSRLKTFLFNQLKLNTDPTCRQRLSSYGAIEIRLSLLLFHTNWPVLVPWDTKFQVVGVNIMKYRKDNNKTVVNKTTRVNGDMRKVTYLTGCSHFPSNMAAIVWRRPIIASMIKVSNGDLWLTRRRQTYQTYWDIS